MKLLLSPHNDDAVLFASFTLLREQPHVITCFESHVQPSRGYQNAGALTRNLEDVDAIHGQLGIDEIQFLGIHDDHHPDMCATQLIQALSKLDNVEHVWAPAFEDDGHIQHNIVATVAAQLFKNKVTHYLTYTKHGKSTNGRRVETEGAWVGKKLRALACYGSQIEIENCRPHFLRDQNEYYQC